MNIKYNVLIVEDHHLLRSGLRSMISGLGAYNVVGEAKDGREACQLAISLRPDLVLTELSMPGMPPIEAITSMKRRAPGIRIIALAGHQDHEYVREALRAGIDGYVLNDAEFEELVVAMSAVMQGKKHLSSEIYGNLIESFVIGHEVSAEKRALDMLSGRERSVLKLVAEGRSNRQVGQYLNLSPKTIEKHRGSLMRKLGISNLTGLVLIAINMGLITSLTKKYYDRSDILPLTLGSGEPNGKNEESSDGLTESPTRSKSGA